MDTTPDFSLRLFSLDSNDTSYIRHENYINELTTQPFANSITIPQDCHSSNNPDFESDSNISTPISNPIKHNPSNQKFVFENLIENLENIGQPKNRANVNNLIKNMPGNATSTSNHSNIQAELELEDTPMESDTIPRHSYEEISQNHNDHPSMPPKKQSFEFLIQKPLHNNSTSKQRNYYEQLFSSDSDDDDSTNISSSDMSISDSSHSSTNESSSDMSISDSDNSTIDVQHSVHSDYSTSSSNSDSDGNSDCSIASNVSFESWEDGNDTWGITKLLHQKEIDNLLGVEEKEYPKPEKECLENEEIDKIGSFNIRNKYDHDLAAFFMMKEDITFLSLQEPFSSITQDSKSWSTYRKNELESARIISYETPFQVILFDSWKWGGKIISPFQSIHHVRATSIAFGFEGNQKIGIISIYASTKECSISHGDDELPPISDLTSSVEKLIKELNHKFPGICIIVMGDFQETITTSDLDNLGTYRKEYNSNGILSSLISTHTSIVRDRNTQSNYITRFGEKGGRGIDHILFPSQFNNKQWIHNAKIDKQRGATYFPSDHSFIHCSIHRKGSNNNLDSESIRKFNYRKICNIKLSQHITESGNTQLKLNESQFKDCDAFKEQKQLYDEVQKLSHNSSSLSEYYLNEIEDRISYLYTKLWKTGTKQKVDGPNNKLVKIDENHAAELSFILRKFQTGVKDIMTHMDCFEDNNSNGSAGTIRHKLRQEKGFHFSKNSPSQSKLRYLKIASKVQLHLLKQILYFCKEYRIRGSSADKDFDLQDINKSWNKIFSDTRVSRQSEDCYRNIMEDIFSREKHSQAIKFAKSNKNTPCVTDSQEQYEPERKDNMLLNTSENVIKLINYWLHDSDCDQGFNSTQKNGDHYSFLNTESNNFIKTIENLDIKVLIAGDANDSRMFYTTIQKSIAQLENFIKKTTRAQFWYKHSTLAFLLETNQIHQFTAKLLHKDRSAPETHSEIWDASLQAMRTCKNEYEELIATSEHHNRWMANSEAKEVCAFAKLKIEGKLGIRGIDLQPDRIVTEADIPSLVHNGHKLSQKIKDQFVAAHGSHTASLFNPPQEDRHELYYPFYLLNAKGSMNEDENFHKKFIKAISGVPSKARYNGFHMAVVGRFGERWQKALLNISKLILILRYIPTDLKRMARFPIPKPGKHNEYRPISLCHDIYCFINGICTKYTSVGIEKANFLHDGIVAYRPGKGCGSLVTIEQCFREDCREHNTPAVQIDEDEEKFFDRIPVEILLAAMRVNGFPEQGFLEIKASGMGAKFVDIITKKGIAYAKFVCGLEQGNPDSPTVANLVIKLKHDVWNYISEKASNIFKKNNSTNNGKYVFNSVDEQDGEVTICKIGYCDDNSKYCVIKDENDLIFLTKYYLQLAGDLSMVTKIGRKGAKSEIQFFNVSAEFALKIEKCFSSAWSFVHDAPLTEEVPIKICLKESERKKFMKISDYENLQHEQQLRWDKIVFPKAHRHLGLSATLSGITQETSRKTLHKMTERIKLLKIQHMQPDSQTKSFNMLCSSIHSFVPLQVSYNSKELENIDRAAVNIIKKSRGLSASDSKHSMFLPKSSGGMGFKSIQDVDLVSVARELEILSNAESIDSEVFRTRLAAILNYDKEEAESCQNHVWTAIKKLARFGIYFRDRSEETINRILSKLEKLPRYQGIGSGRFRNGNDPYMGTGKDKNLDIVFGGPVHQLLRKLEKLNWNISDFKKLHPGKNPINLKLISTFRRQAGEEYFAELTDYYSCWEWINTSNSTSIPTSRNQWRFININKIIKKKFPTSYWELTDQNIREEAERILSIYPHQKSSKKSQNTHDYMDDFPSYDELWSKIEASSSPIFIATDGAHSKSIKSTALSNETGKEIIHHTSSSFVVCQADLGDRLTPNTPKKVSSWIDKPCIPLLSRVSSLPQQMGTDESDVAHGEAHAIAMQEWALPKCLPRIIITDSEAIRNVSMELRDKESKTVDRKLIRTTLGGISKSITSTLFRNLHHTEMNANLHRRASGNNNFGNIFNQLQQRTNDIIDQAKMWKSSEGEEEFIDNVYGPWRTDYHDENKHRTFFKVNSHQLDESGTKISMNKRYPKLTPNLCLLNMNHHADVTAELSTHLDKNRKEGPTRTFKNPDSILRFYFSWEGHTVDRHISVFVQDKIYAERISRVKTKATQGLMWRIMDHVTITWNDIQLHKGWERALRGLSRTHSRSIYKSENYREGCRLEYISSERKDACTPTSLKKSILISKLSKCMWCKEFNEDSKCQHGNRRHAMLTCNHPQLQKFRRKMTNLIEQKLRMLFNLLKGHTNKKYLLDLIHNIEKECIQLQNTHIGHTSSKTKHSTRHGYVSLTELQKKYDLSHIFDGFQANGHLFCSEIMGIVDQAPAMPINDMDIHILDAYWLGLTPSSMDRLIQRASSSKNLFAFTPNKAACSAASADLLSTWNEVKDLLMAKAIGLHRIIGSISKEKEKNMRVKHNLNKGTYKELRLKRKEAELHSQNSSSDETTHDTKPTHDNKRRKILCQGITCNKTNKRWCLDQNFNVNRIEENKKHCSRCSRFGTSMKQSAQILTNIHSNSTNVNLTQLQTQLSTSATDGIDYLSMMNSLKTCQLLPESSTETKSNKKTRVHDRHKMICRILVQSFKTSQSQDQTFQNESSTISQNIMQGIQSSEQIIKSNAKKASQDPHPFFENKNATTIDLTSQHDRPDHKEASKTQQLSGNTIIQHLQEEITVDGNFISDDAITKTVEVVRDSLGSSNIFIAHGLSNININSWASTQGWERFSRIFNSRKATFSKPNGTYLIPIFSGDNAHGHWHLMIIQKTCRTSCHGWILDSLGQGQISSDIINRTTEAFSHSSRGSVKWHAPKCFRQTENECGPRTLKGIIDICNNLKMGVSIEECITRATMLHMNNSVYNATTLRREVAAVLSTHTNNMARQLVHFRKREGKIMAARSASRKRAPRKNHKKKA